jgi:hypothetical protein
VEGGEFPVDLKLYQLLAQARPILIRMLIRRRLLVISPACAIRSQYLLP